MNCQNNRFLLTLKSRRVSIWKKICETLHIAIWSKFLTISFVNVCKVQAPPSPCSHLFSLWHPPPPLVLTLFMDGTHGVIWTRLFDQIVQGCKNLFKLPHWGNQVLGPKSRKIQGDSFNVRQRATNPQTASSEFFLLATSLNIPNVVVGHTGKKICCEFDYP